MQSKFCLINIGNGGIVKRRQQTIEGNLNSASVKLPRHCRQRTQKQSIHLNVTISHESEEWRRGIISRAQKAVKYQTTRYNVWWFSLYTPAIAIKFRGVTNHPYISPHTQRTHSSPSLSRQPSVPIQPNHKLFNNFKYPRTIKIHCPFQLPSLPAIRRSSCMAGLSMTATLYFFFLCVAIVEWKLFGMSGCVLRCARHVNGQRHVDQKNEQKQCNKTFNVEIESAPSTVEDATRDDPARTWLKRRMRCNTLVSRTIASSS